MNRDELAARIAAWRAACVRQQEAGGYELPRPIENVVARALDECAAQFEAKPDAALESDLKRMRLAYDATLAEIDEATVERAVVAFAERDLDGAGWDWDTLDPDIQQMYRDDVKFILRAAREG